MPSPFPKRPHTVRTVVLSVLGTLVGLAIVFVSIVYFASRGANEATYALPPRTGVGISDESLATPMYEPAPSRAPSVSSGAAGSTAEERERTGPKIIRVGVLRVRVDDAARRLEEAKRLATQYGGFVADVTLEDQEGYRTAEIVIRVPSNKFDELVASAKKLAAMVFSEETNAEDVTDIYIDLEARLKAAKAEEAQYLDILKQARTVEDTLKVAEALGEVRSRIELLEGRMRLLRDRTDYATLRIVMTEETKVEVPLRTWAPFETIRQAFQGLVSALQSAIDLLINLGIYGIGLVLPAVLILWGVYRLVRKLIWRLRR